ncbi:MBL fold metallo-hydrolase [Streptomyces sp. MMG1121]|uniref:MBL fold metallo-hydrolase n=1 Tax=Streptomyces sp. MMG1121 TaxID=1415544 RepID=UPI002D21D893|nr:MBL fold metallo-hydrolase [Streptomyces sp. MMG1121]
MDDGEGNAGERASAANALLPGATGRAVHGRPDPGRRADSPPRGCRLAGRPHPGHTPGHLALGQPEERLLVVGDALSDYDVGWVDPLESRPWRLSRAIFRSPGATPLDHRTTRHHREHGHLAGWGIRLGPSPGRPTVAGTCRGPGLQQDGGVVAVADVLRAGADSTVTSQRPSIRAAASRWEAVGYDGKPCGSRRRPGTAGPHPVRERVDGLSARVLDRSATWLRRRYERSRRRPLRISRMRSLSVGCVHFGPGRWTARCLCASW